MKKILVTGSIAYDTIMVFRDRFRNHILPDQIHILNVSFLVPDMRREFGGCAGNIAYNLQLIGGQPQIMATVGDDAQPYAYRLEKLQLSAQHVRQLIFALERCGVAPDGPLTADDLAGLPLPQRLFE